MSYRTTISLVGDVLISRHLPPPTIKNCQLGRIRELLSGHDCRFGNLETTIHNREGYPESFPGGGYAMAPPACLDDLKNLGFNLMSTANNHAMDYSHNGLLATCRYLKAKDITFAGTGENLSDASSAAYIECQNARVALISITSSFHDSYLAGPQNQDMIGRPGVNPLRHKAVYELNQEDLNKLIDIAQKTGINSYHNNAIKQGYLQAAQNFKFGNFEFMPGQDGVLHTTPDERDLDRTIKAVRDAKRISDVVIVSVHGHQFKGESTISPDFISIYAKQCIDAGATIIVCHGPHIMRGIETYKNGVIFHGLGNFICQHDQAMYLPEEFYQKYGMTRQMSDGVNEIYNVRSKDGKVGLRTIKDCWRSVLASLTIEDNRIGITLYPIQLNRYGVCEISDDISILEDIKQLSTPFDTPIEISKSSCTASITINTK